MCHTTHIYNYKDTKLIIDTQLSHVSNFLRDTLSMVHQVCRCRGVYCNQCISCGIWLSLFLAYYSLFNVQAWTSLTKVMGSFCQCFCYRNLSHHTFNFPYEFYQFCRSEMVVGWYHSHPGFGCWLSGVDINTQQV